MAVEPYERVFSLLKGGCVVHREGRCPVWTYSLAWGAIMKLTVYLTRQDITDFDGLIREKYLRQDGYEVLESREDLGFPLRAYVLRIRETEPKWVAFLRHYFDVDEVVNSLASFVLLAQVSGRIFALTFGQAFHTIERSLFEPNFGLRVVANMIDDSGLKTVDTRNLDTVTRQQRTQVSVGSKLVDFELDLDQEWVRKLSGKSADQTFARSMSGSDSLSINLELALADLPKVLSRLLELHAGTSYRKSFGFIDHYRPLRKDDPAVEQLEKALIQRISSRDHEKIALAFPEVIDDEDVAHVRVNAAYHSNDLEDLTLDGLYAVLDRNKPLRNPLQQVRIVPINDSEEPVGGLRPLKDYLVCELDLADKTYVLSLGDWFEVNRDYVRSINAAVAAIDDLTGHLALPDWRTSEDEGAYNDRAAHERGWALLDKANFQIGGPNQKIEICDLLTAGLHMICVKKRTRSATLSHLFSQGSVSADLYRGEPTYRDRVRAAVPANSDGDQASSEEPTIVYAIATDRPGVLIDSLFFFSKVNLVAHAKDIRRRGLKVGIAKIQLKA